MNSNSSSNNNSFLKNTNKPQISDFDLLPFPVVMVNTSGKVIYKNLFTNKLKRIKINSNFSKLLVESSRENFFSSIKNNESCVFECRRDLGFSHAVTICYPDGSTVIFLIICSVIIREMESAGFLDAEMRTYKTNEYIISTYKDMCEKLNRAVNPETAELLRCNALRFSRAARYFSLYADITVRHHISEQKRACDINDLCTSIIKYFSSKVSALGYRLNISADGKNFNADIQKSSFVCVFLELVAISLRCARDYSCNIKMQSLDEQIFIDYEFCDSSIAAAETVFEVEFDFISEICRNCNWNFSGIKTANDGITSMSLSLPAEKLSSDKYNQISASAPSFFESSDANEMLLIADEIYSSIFFS